MRERPNATIKETYEEVAARVKKVSTAKDRLQEPRLDSRYYKDSLGVPFLSLPRPPEETLRAALKVAVKVINEKGQAIKMTRVTLLPARGKVAAATGSSAGNGVFETKSPLKAGE